MIWITVIFNFDIDFVGMKSQGIGVIFLLSAFSLFSQHSDHAAVHKEQYQHFRFSVNLSHTYLPESTVEGKSILVLPSFGLDIEYWLGRSVGIGLHNDLELLQFEIVTDDEVTIEREFPVLATLDVLWKPYKDLVLFGGPGMEFEPSENYLVLRIGMEYEIPVHAHFDLSPIVFYDFRKEAYNTFSVGLGIGFHTH
ncbi:MAG: hypothetical protein R3275_09985 [Saprospiraceae bacterium]|nr:hypothetical protein [Saprospiraceae bacterium]